MTERQAADPAARALKLVRRINTLAREERAPLMRELAVAVVDLRVYLNDLRGASYAYRQTFGDILTNGGVPDDERETFQQAIRYHVSNVLRERFTDAQLEASGLRPQSARDRARQGRSDRSALVRAVRGEETSLAALKALQGAEALLQRIAEEALADLSPEEHRCALTAATNIKARATALQRALRNAAVTL